MFIVQALGASNERGEQPFIDRSAVGRALSCWDRLRKIKEFPSRADCLEIFDRDLANGIIVIQFTPREEDDLIVECGPLFRDAYGRNPVGLAAKNSALVNLSWGDLLARRRGNGKTHFRCRRIYQFAWRRRPVSQRHPVDFRRRQENYPPDGDFQL